MASIAWLKPPLVSDEPATRLTEISSMSSPTTTSAMPPMNWPWYCLGFALLRVARHLDVRDDIALERDGDRDRLDGLGRRVRAFGGVGAVDVGAVAGRAGVAGGTGRRSSRPSRCRPPAPSRWPCRAAGERQRAGDADDGDADLTGPGRRERGAVVWIMGGPPSAVPRGEVSAMLTRVLRHPRCVAYESAFEPGRARRVVPAPAHELEQLDGEEDRDREHERKPPRPDRERARAEEVVHERHVRVHELQGDQRERRPPDRGVSRGARRA